MIGDVIHPVSEFGDFPWDQLKPEDYGQSWDFEVGFTSDGLTGTIQIFHEDSTKPFDLSCDIWVMPDSLSALIQKARKCEADEVRKKIRNAIGIFD